VKEIEVPKPYPVEKIVEKYIKVPTPYPVKVAVPVEKIKEVKVPVFIPAPPLKSAHHHNQQNSIGDQFNGFPGNFDDSFFASSKNHENLKKKHRFNPENNPQDDEPYRRNINLRGNKHHQQQFLHQNQQNQQQNQQQERQQNQQQQIQHNQQQQNLQNQINHQQRNPAHANNITPQQLNNYQNHKEKQQQNQQNHLNQQQQSHHPQFAVVTIPKNLHKIPFDTPQPPSGFTLNTNFNNNNNNQKQKTQNHPHHLPHEQNQNGPGSYVIHHNFPSQTLKPVDDHVTEASTQYETFSAFPHPQYAQQVVTPQNYYQTQIPHQEILPIPQQQIAYSPQPLPQQQYAQASEPQYQIQYPNNQQIPQNFQHSQAIINPEVFQPSFGIPQQ